MLQYKEIDVDFIEFYIKKKHNQRLHDYFNVSRPVASAWRNAGLVGTVVLSPALCHD